MLELWGFSNYMFVVNLTIGVPCVTHCLMAYDCLPLIPNLDRCQTSYNQPLRQLGYLTLQSTCRIMLR